MLKKIVRRFLVGSQQRFEFAHVDPVQFRIPPVDKIHLYIHIPFCKSMCPYCPYNRIQYKEGLVKGYIQSLKKEIEMYREQLGCIDIESVYIGGGTPTTVIYDLVDIMDNVRSSFNLSGDVAMETTVADIHKENLGKIKQMGVTMLSVGIQSFHDRYLKLLGRNYLAKDIVPAMQLIQDSGIDHVNVDLMFAYPGQTTGEVQYDIEQVNKLGIDQVTAYPLFTFPYSTIGSYLHVRRIQMPKIWERRKLYNQIYDFFVSHNYHRSSVWSFNRERSTSSYSSVTRLAYIGLGAGAASRFEGTYYFNTFSTSAYVQSLKKDVLPVSVSMPITQSLSRYYWFYWKLYKTHFTLTEFKPKADWKMRLILVVLMVLGFCQKKGSNISLTRKGAFWVHLLQNHFVLDYIDKVWCAMKKTPFPEKIDF